MNIRIGSKGVLAEGELSENGLEALDDMPL